MQKVKSVEWLKNFGLVIFLMLPAFAQAAGLDAGTSALSSFQTWMYTILGVGATCFLVYKIIQAMMDSIGWMQVAIAVGYVALAGAAVVLATYAWSIWGS